MYIRVDTHRRSQNSIWLVAIAVLSLAPVPLLSGTVLSPSPDTSLDNISAVRSDFGNLPLSFEPNQGQTNESVRFLTPASGGTLYFTPGEVVLSLPSGIKGETDQVRNVGSPAENAPISAPAQQSVVRMQFVDANPSTSIQSGEMLPGKVNYFIGNDPSKWHSGLPTYGNVTYTGLYSGVDLAYSGTGGQLKGTYTVAAGTDPSQIRWRYSGAEKVSVDGAGNLQIMVAIAANTPKEAQAVSVTEQVPVAWQEIAGERIPVSARFLVAPDQSIGFVLGSYDHNHPLIIDPTLTYSTYLGGSGLDIGEGIAADTSGNAYVTGSTYSTDFPLQDSYQPTHGGSYDAFVTKFNATGSTLLYSTYLGGSGFDWGRDIAVDTLGNAYVTGYTYSTNFPLQDPFQPAFGGGTRDAFVTRFSATGSTLSYSTYLGGSDADRGSGIAVDTLGNAYIMGDTDSTNFPLQDPFQPTFGGDESDAFVTRFNATGSTLLYSTYLGGSSDDWGRDIAVDTLGNAYVTGSTGSTDFPLQNPFQPTHGGSYDAFVTRFNATGSTLLYSTYLGGSSSEFSHGIAVDASGNAYVTGHTYSVDFPVQNPFQPTYGGSGDVFVTRFSATGSTLIYSTYLGGSSSDYGYGIAVDALGNAYVTGSTESTNFPLQNPFQPTHGGGGSDAFVAKISDQPISTPTPTATSVPPTSTSTSTATPVPPTGTPSSCVRKADICHRTGNGSYHQISVSCNTLPGHIGHGDIYPVPPGGCPGESGPVQPVFPDVPTTSTYFNYINDIYQMGAISGYADGTFRPNNTATRAQVAEMAVLVSGISMEGTSHVQHFVDVEPSSRYFTYYVRHGLHACSALTT